MFTYENLFGEFTEEEIKNFKEAVNAPVEKIYSEGEMELWPEDDGDDDWILEHVKKEHENG